MAEKILKVEHLKKSYDGKTNVLDDISFGIEKGEVVVIVGPSGCGKSTFLRCLNKLESINEGALKLDGQNYENEKNGGCWYYLNRSEKEYTPAVVSFSGKTLDVTKTSLTIKKGKRATIKATAMPKTKITYQSKNKKVATVNSKGVVRGIRKGKTTILVTANGKTVKVQITVK